MTNLILPFEENQFYHVFNRGNNGGLLFFEERNYNYFLRKLDQYLSDYLCIYAYCLLPNHFHLLVSVKDFSQLPLEKRYIKKGAQLISKPHEIISERFRCFFLSYSKSIKQQEKRTGSLFEKNHKRLQIESESYLIALINYIHRNPETHQIIEDFKAYPYSSFQSMLSEKPTKLMRHDVVEWFGGKDHFIKYHNGNPVFKDRITLE
jgi:putative transposase